VGSPTNTYSSAGPSRSESSSRGTTSCLNSTPTPTPPPTTKSTAAKTRLPSPTTYPTSHRHRAWNGSTSATIRSLHLGERSRQGRCCRRIQGRNTAAYARRRGGTRRTQSPCGTTGNVRRASPSRATKLRRRTQRRAHHATGPTQPERLDPRHWHAAPTTMQTCGTAPPPAPRE
jgi:hypothetical protein